MVGATSTPDPPLHVGLLQCGHLPEDLVAAHGDYPTVFADLLRPHGIEIEAWDVTAGPPPDVDACAGWLVSGSPDSTYEPLPWIAPVEQFLRDAVDARAPLVAVCFGHQLLAQAMGGRVARAPVGWGVGVHAYELAPTGAGWMEPAPPDGRVCLIASHQDQVVELPEGARVVAWTEHCKVAAYTLGPAALAIQPHPEFTADMSRMLIERRRRRIGDAAANAGLASLDQPLHQDLVAAWMAAFLRQAARARTPSVALEA